MLCLQRALVACVCPAEALQEPTPESCYGTVAAILFAVTGQNPWLPLPLAFPTHSRKTLSPPKSHTAVHVGCKVFRSLFAFGLCRPILSRRCFKSFSRPLCTSLFDLLLVIAGPWGDDGRMQEQAPYWLWAKACSILPGWMQRKLMEEVKPGLELSFVTAVKAT